MNDQKNDARQSEMVETEAVARAEVRQAWRAAPERTKWIRSSALTAGCLLILGAVVGAVSAGISYDPNYSAFDSLFENVVVFSGGGALIGSILAISPSQLFFQYQRRAFRDRHIVGRARLELDKAEDEVRAGADDTSFSALWVATQKRLGYYHEIAISQSQRSFAYGQAAAGAGMLMVLVCTVLAIVAESTAGAVSAGILGGSSAALAGYIGATFLRTQDLASQQLRAYFAQPLEFSRFLSAERLIADLSSDDRRQEAILILIRAMAKEELPAQ